MNKINVYNVLSSSSKSEDDILTRRVVQRRNDLFIEVDDVNFKKIIDLIQIVLLMIIRQGIVQFTLRYSKIFDKLPTEIRSS